MASGDFGIRRQTRSPAAQPPSARARASRFDSVSSPE